MLEVAKISKHSKQVANEAGLRTFLDQLEDRLEEIEVEYGENLYKKYLHEPCKDINEIERRRSEIILNDHYLDIVRQWRPRARDELLKKRLRALEQLFLRERIEALPEVFQSRNKINEEHIAFKPVVLGKEMQRTDVYEMLRKDSDTSRRKAAWESFAELSRKVEADVKKLMKLRNQHAEELGYKTYADHLLIQNLIDKAELLSLYDELSSLSEPILRSVLEEIQEKLDIDQLQPWDISYAIDQFVKPPDEHFPRDLILPKVKELVRSFGLIPEKLPILVREADIPFGGLCFGIKIPTDMRILSNPRDGHRFYNTLFHEYGHALHGSFIRQKHFSLKGEMGCFAEGMARILEHFASDYDWLRENTSLSEDEILRFINARKASRLLSIRNLIAASVFEFQAYENPERDLNRLWSQLRAKYMFLPENETPQWAAQSIYTTHPIYFQNYVLADLIAAQTIAYLREKYGSLLGNSEVSKFLIDNYYSPGASIDWPERIRKATGKKLSAEALVDELTK
ncbi:MAG: M3 family metallopeptidase [Candidatus Bathyarchaeia archaeon]